MSTNGILQPFGARAEEMVEARTKPLSGDTVLLEEGGAIVDQFRVVTVHGRPPQWGLWDIEGSDGRRHTITGRRRETEGTPLWIVDRTASPLEVGAQLPERWRSHPLAYTLAGAEIALCQAVAEQRRAERRVERAAQEHEEADAALDPALTAVVLASTEVERAREALTRAMAEPGS